MNGEGKKTMGGTLTREGWGKEEMYCGRGQVWLWIMLAIKFVKIMKEKQI